MIRLYRTGSLQGTPFHPEQHDAVSFFYDNGITFTNNLLNCNLFVTGQSIPADWYTRLRKIQLLLRYQFRRHMLIWSNEPINTMVEPTFRWSRSQPVAHVMNLYTNDVFLNNFTFQTLSSVVAMHAPGDHSPQQVLAQSRGRRSSEHRPPAPPKGIKRKRPQVSDLGLDRGRLCPLLPH